MSDTPSITIHRAAAVKIAALLDGMDNPEAASMARHVHKSIAAYDARRVCSYYRPSALLREKEIMHGEIVGIIQSLKELARIYEPGTAKVMKAARRLIIGQTQMILAQRKDIRYMKDNERMTEY